jgi:hypothetical protein
MPASAGPTASLPRNPLHTGITPRPPTQLPAVLNPADRASYRSYADTERYQPSEQLHATYDGQPSSHHKP